jgi:hypothetical protein
VLNDHFLEGYQTIVQLMFLIILLLFNISYINHNLLFQIITFVLIINLIN